MPSVINATSGALKASSIKTCPDGYEYGYHGDGHWHFAEKRGKQYYAQGEALDANPCKKIVVSFNANGGSVDKDSKTVYKGWNYEKDKAYTYGKLPTPVRKGYTFDGWYTEKTEGINILSTTKVKKIYTLYAHWTKIKYKITYELNGGINNEDNPTKYKVTSVITFKKPTKKGYIFKGWYKDSEFKKEITSISKGTTGNKKLYAKWKAVRYVIQFDKNGGTGTMKNSPTLKYSTSYTLPKVKFTRKGYSFVGWNTKKDGTGTSFDNKAVVKKLTTKNNKTVILYARWSKIKYDINYYLDGGTNNELNPSYYKITDTIVLSNPTKDGYNFKGWYKDSEFKTKSNTIEKGSTGVKDFYAKWEKKILNITYELNGGVNNNDNINTFTIEDEVALYEPTRDFYTFDGWYIEEELENRIEKIEIGTSSDIVLYAKWIPVNYNIVYHLNGGINNEQNVSTYTIEDEITFYEPTKEGYSFYGWYSENTFENEVTKINKGSTGVVELYAKWGDKRYSITYELDGGTNNSNNVNIYTVKDSVEFYDPTKKGYTFDGWYSEEGFENKIEGIEEGTTGDITLYAKWIPVNYNIVYHLNGGINNEQNVSTYTIEDEITFYEPTKEGYSFYGWYSENTFENEVTKINKGSTGDVTLYAKWGDIRYSITYELDGGTNNPDNVLYFKPSDEITLLDPTKKGYDFLGWYDDSLFTNKVTKIEEGTNEDVVLYAKWKIVNYQINYNLGGGTNNPDNIKSYTVLDSFTFLEPTRSGFDFDGWRVEGFSGPHYDEIVVGTTGVINIYAKWNPRTYHIYYVLDGGTNDSYNPDTFRSDESVFLHTPIKSGYMFGGWFLDPEFTQKIQDIPYGTDHDITVYVRWDSPSSNEDALARAMIYLSERPYSRDRLYYAIQEMDGFTEDAATYAVENCGADWFEQAVLLAKKLEKTWPYSRLKLKQALIMYEYFTEEQAEYGVENSEINWNDQAQRFAHNAVLNNTYTYDELVEYMISEGFTEEQATIGADYVF